MRKHRIVLSLLVLAIAASVGCGNSTTSTFTKIALLSTQPVDPPTSLFTANLDGTNVTPIPSSLTDVWSLSTSADGKTVAFIARNAGAFQLWVSKSDGSGQQQVPGPDNARWARISPSGKEIVFFDFTVFHVVLIHPDGTGVLDLTPTLPEGVTECYDASFSADSSQVVFACYGSSVGYGVYTIKTDGTGIKLIETRLAKSGLSLPQLAPDGKKVFFLGYVEGTWGVVSVNIDGTGETMVVPDVDEFVVLNSNIYYMNDCSNPAPLFKSNLDGTSPVQVNDGTKAVYLFYPTGGC
ncbi:MAG: hypothetical protein HY010_21425 [Acidobacteria bacterium]|nr:hypothetical protein [Acidobacteriota bacterium]